MKLNYKKQILAISLNFLLLICASGQTTSPSPGNSTEEGRRANQEIQNQQQLRRIEELKQARTAGQAREDLGRLGISTERTLEPDQERVNASKELLRQYKRTKSLLLPPEGYSEKYKAQLKGDKYELARLHPERDCAVKLVISSKDVERCADAVPVQGGGSQYSFFSKLNYLSRADYLRLQYGETPVMYESDRREPVLDIISNNKLNILNNWWNLHFSGNRFEVSKNLIQGVISDLGKADLETISINSPEINVLTEYQPGKTIGEALMHSKGLEKGIGLGSLVYSTSAPAEVGHTYILRSILYPYKPDRVDSNQKTYTSKGTDITIAFNVVGKETDGSLIILWKELQKKKLSQKYKM